MSIIINFKKHGRRFVLLITIFSLFSFITSASSLWANPRFSGEGNIFTKDGVRISHEFDLYCIIGEPPNHLSVRWAGNRFRLDTLSSSNCYDDPSISSNTPMAGIDTYVGTGLGSYNGVAGATVRWKVTDAGEPGTNDFFSVLIKDAAGNILLSAADNLVSGNHKVQP